MATNSASIGEMIAIVAAIFGIVGVIYAIKAYYKKDNRPSQTAIGKNINQAGRDITRRNDD